MGLDKDCIVGKLNAGAKSYACGGFIQSLSRMQRQALFAELCFDRLERKCRYIREIFHHYNYDWLQTIYHMLLRSLDVGRNRQTYLLLSDTIPFKVLQREDFDSVAVECLIMGCSGLLDTFENDSYIKSLKDEFGYLAHKYNLSAITPSCWDTGRILPAKHPLVRLSQLANFISDNRLSIENICKCRSIQDVERLFRINAKHYWCDVVNMSNGHFVPPIYIGYDKSHLLGINFIVPLQLAYASFTGDEPLHDNALRLIESIDAENNHYTRGWASYGVQSKSALDSQALIQLASEFCAKNRCEECPVAKLFMKNLATMG